METLIQFEREEGDLASYETALEKCAAQMKRLAGRREKVGCYSLLVSYKDTSSGPEAYT